MNKKDIKNLERWENYRDLKFDSIYIVPTRDKLAGFNTAYYLGKIGEDIKILDKYDCGIIYSDMINIDFEDIYGGIKLWSSYKLKYKYGGRINIWNNN